MRVKAGDFRRNGEEGGESDVQAPFWAGSLSGPVMALKGDSSEKKPRKDGEFP